MGGIFQNQSAAGDVIQQIKKKESLNMHNARFVDVHYARILKLIAKDCLFQNLKMMDSFHLVAVKILTKMGKL